MTRIIDPVLVDENRPHQPTELDQSMPVAAVASQPRRLDGEHRADSGLAHRRQQPLESRSVDPTCRAAEIIVDDFDRGPPKLPGAIGERVLTAAPLRIVQDLIARRLADIDEGAAAQVISRDLDHRPPSRPGRLRSPAAVLRPASPAAPSARRSLPRAPRPGRTTLADSLRSCASLATFSIRDSGWRKRRSSSISARRDRKTWSGIRASAQSW